MSDTLGFIIERAALKDRVAELEKDAARWKWMRDNCATYPSTKVPIQLVVQEHADVHRTHGAVGYRSGLDAAIDKAMAGKESS